MTDQQMSQDEFATYIAQKIRTLHSQSRAPQFIALNGRDCAGKSTLAKDVHQQLSRLGLSATLLSIDAFLIPRHLRTPSTPEHIDYFENAFDYTALVQALETIKNRASSVDPNSYDIVLVEGVFLLREELYHWWDLTVWVEADTAMIMDRAIKRDKKYFGDEHTVRRVYENRCLPAQNYHIQRDLPKQNADITATFENGTWRVTTTFFSDGEYAAQK
ncbi:MAG: hypothetical protein OXU36_07755 [Candidatus Poribacteria bacterium]|nr:hypothetical protein [Candidatus Poribacteria bacterium]